MSNNVSVNKLLSIKPKSIRVASNALVNIDNLTISDFGLAFTPKDTELDLVAWARNHKMFIQEKLLKHSVLLFRDFSIGSMESFTQFATDASKKLMDYEYGSTPRKALGGKVYTTTEYPPNQIIVQHNELSYAHTWPLKLFLYCLVPAGQGGETPLCDSNKIYRLIDPAIKNQFEKKNVLYVRNYYPYLNPNWQNVFQTEEKVEVEKYCRENNINYQWKGEHSLQTRQISQAVTKHPISGIKVWFNQAHLFHVSNLDVRVRDQFLASMQIQDLPRNAYYGDGSEIETSALDEIRGIYEDNQLVFSWKKNDVVIVDNMLASHGRLSYVGARKVCIALADPYQANSIDSL